MSIECNQDDINMNISGMDHIHRPVIIGLRYRSKGIAQDRDNLVGAHAFSQAR